MSLITNKVGKFEYITAEGVSVSHCFTTRFGGVSEGYLSSLNLGIHRGDKPENVVRNYEILGEKELRPIINVQPTYDSCYEEIEKLALHPERIPLLQQQSIDYVKKHHDYIKVAQQYLDFYHSL